MSKKNIQKSEDIFGLEIPASSSDVDVTTTSSIEVKPTEQFMTYFQANPITLYSTISTLVILLIILCIILGKITKRTNPMLEYAKQQTKKLKKDQAYVSSTNKLETPDNLIDCIKAFIERTK
ncbi:hypothetical protein IJD44_02185 [bacterium]|nr:hypothetical protein [bacterium]